MAWLNTWSAWRCMKADIAWRETGSFGWNPPSLKPLAIPLSAIHAMSSTNGLVSGTSGKTWVAQAPGPAGRPATTTSTIAASGARRDGRAEWRGMAGLPHETDGPDHLRRHQRPRGGFSPSERPTWSVVRYG